MDEAGAELSLSEEGVSDLLERLVELVHLPLRVHVRKEPPAQLTQVIHELKVVQLLTHSLLVLDVYKIL